MRNKPMDIRQPNVNYPYPARQVREEFLDPDTGRHQQEHERYRYPEGANLLNGFAPTGMTTTDFSIIRIGGTFHLYGVAGAEGAFTNWPGQYEYVFHAVSDDLDRWTMLGKALQPHPDHPYEAHKIWPPYIFHDNDLYWMVYTALDEQNCQSLGMAVSDDAYRWRRISDLPIVDPGRLDWTLKRPDGKVRHCRDPHVEKIGSLYYLYYSTVCEDGNPGVGLAASADLSEWTDCGPCAKNSSPQSWIMESPLLIRVNEGWLLWCLPFNRVLLSDDPTSFHQATAFPVEGLKKVIAPEIVRRIDDQRFLIGFYGPLGKRISFGIADWNGKRLQVDPVSSREQLMPYI